MKIMEGLNLLAYLNISLIALADSPTYFPTIDEPTILMNVALTEEAIALAINVFPVPGGPYNKIPFGYLIPIRV